MGVKMMLGSTGAGVGFLLGHVRLCDGCHISAQANVLLLSCHHSMIYYFLFFHLFAFLFNF
ncbi:hypothetical protein BJ741DRAFT_610581 [Chytriomyces cf. hyalinus JEL632]|nr:hypothetical protein BJ741DRAFT_610581 [Chytriomyces cf. hyalinus JEL632]